MGRDSGILISKVKDIVKAHMRSVYDMICMVVPACEMRWWHSQIDVSEPSFLGLGFLENRLSKKKK